jgi:hypothetical protein
LRGRQADLALNLPYTSTPKSHDVSFEKNDLNVNCWTPRLLLVSTEHKRGEQAAEKVWQNMLDNSAAGAFRAGKTAVSVHLDMPQPAGHFYFVELSKFEGAALLQRRRRSERDWDQVRLSQLRPKGRQLESYSGRSSAGQDNQRDRSRRDFRVERDPRGSLERRPRRSSFILKIPTERSPRARAWCLRRRPSLCLRKDAESRR